MLFSFTYILSILYINDICWSNLHHNINPYDIVQLNAFMGLSRFCCAICLVWGWGLDI